MTDITSHTHEADVADLATHGYQQRLHRGLGSFSSFAAGFSYISILTGMFQLFGFGYGFGGPLMFWTWILVLAGQFAVALVFAELSARYPIAGSVYQWSKKVASKPVSWLAGWTMMIGSVVTVAAVAIAWQIVLPPIWSGFQVFSSNAQNAVFFGCILIVIVTVINILGVNWMSKINNVGVAAELIGVAVIIILLFTHSKRSPGVVLTTQGIGASAPGFHTLGWLAPFLLASVMAAYVMFGFDTAGSLAEETKNPRRTTPMAILRALGAAGIAGLILLLAALMAAGSLKVSDLGAGGLPYVLQSSLGDTLGKILLVDVAIAIFVCCLAIQTAAIRLAFSMARDHALPFGEGLAHVSQQRHAPAAPAIVSGLVAIAILVVDIGNTQIFLTVTSVSIVIVYLAYLMVTVPVLAKRLRGWPTAADAASGLTGIFTMPRWAGIAVNVFAAAYGLLMGANLIWPRAAVYGPGMYEWGAVITVAAVTAIGLAYYFTAQHKREARIAAEHAAEAPALAGASD
jgi:urea carboxylase system permease